MVVVVKLVVIDVVVAVKLVVIDNATREAQKNISRFCTDGKRLRFWEEGRRMAEDGRRNKE